MSEARARRILWRFLRGRLISSGHLFMTMTLFDHMQTDNLARRLLGAYRFARRFSREATKP